jgi:regulator of replication initiation timing
MNDIVREMTREELVALNNTLRAENEKLKAELEEARLAAEHNRHVAEENQLKCELRYRDGVIYGMKYALRCNGISGGEMEKRYE